MNINTSNINTFSSLDDQTLLKFPPFYTEQINHIILQSQLESWYRIIASNSILLERKFLHITDAQCMESPFINPSINRNINRYFLVLIIEFLIEQKLALWLEPLSDLSNNIFIPLVKDTNAMKILYVKHIEFRDNLKSITNDKIKDFNYNQIECLKKSRDNFFKTQIKDARAALYPIPIDRLCDELKEFAKLLCLYDNVETVYNLFYSPLGQKYKFHRLPDEHITYLISFLVYNNWAVIILPPSIRNNITDHHNIKNLGIKFI